MAIQLDPARLVPEFPPLVPPVRLTKTDEEELSLCNSLLLFGMTLLGKREDVVTLFCQQLEELTLGQAKVQLFQRIDQKRYSVEAKTAFALLRDHVYTVHLHGRYYGWLVTTDLSEFSPILLKLGVHSSRQAVQVAFLTGLYQPLENLAPVIFLDEQEQDC